MGQEQSVNALAEHLAQKGNFVKKVCLFGSIPKHAHDNYAVHAVMNMVPRVPVVWGGLDSYGQNI